MQGLSRHTRHTLRRAHRRRAIELNIVSMIDILTVLVFFLLVNALGVSVLGVNLPPPNSEPPKTPPLNLRLIVRSDSLELVSRDGTIGKRMPNNATGYDFQDMAELLNQVKDRVPDEDKIPLLLEPGIAYDTLVQVMDVVRLDPGGNGKPERELFPAISMGDAPLTQGGAP